jgi:uncharacterized protein YndB with AHSA1/START domain
MPPISCATYIQALPSRVFEALTVGAEWDRWFTTRAVIEPEAGGTYRLHWRDFGPDHVTLTLTGAVLEVEPDRIFAFEWDSGARMTTVRFELEPRGEGTVVRLTESGYTDREADVVSCLDCAAGWGEALTLLKFYLEHGVTYGSVPPP